MGCHAGVTPIVNGVKKRTPLLGGVNTKKRGGTGVDVSIRHSTPLPPSLGLGRGKGEIHRGSNYFVFCFFCDNMLFFRVRKKEKKTVATYPGHRWFFLTSPSQDWHFDERVFRLVKIYEKNACMEKKHHARTLPHTGHVKNSDEGSPDFVVGQSFLECVVFLSSRHCFYFFPDMDRKNLCCACSAWSGFSVARTFFRPRFITHRPDLCQIGGMSSPDKKDSFRVIYFKNRALKDSKKRVDPAPSSLL